MTYFLCDVQEIKKKCPHLHLSLESTHCSLGHIQPQIDRVSQTRHLKLKTNSNRR